MNEVIQVIKFLLKGYKNDTKGLENALVSEVNGKTYYIWNCDYLLNQVIRHYNIPQERYYYSKAAKQLWEDLGFELKDLKTKYYREQIIPLNDNVKCSLYKGSNTKPYKENVGRSDSFPFNDAFHLEHIVPISKIIDELIRLENPNDNEIEAVLKKYVSQESLSTKTAAYITKIKEVAHSIIFIQVYIKKKESFYLTI